MDPKLDHLKKIFRSLLLPEMNGATMQHLRKLYFEMEGEEIPYRRFGFNTDIELLNTMNSVVRMRLDKYGNMKVYAEKSTESQHIVDLVAAQNRKPRRHYNQLRTPRPKQWTQPSNTSNRQQVYFGHRQNRNASNFGSFRTKSAFNQTTEYDSWHQQPIAKSTKQAESDSWNQRIVPNSTTITKIGLQHQNLMLSPAKPSVDSSFQNSNSKSMNNFTLSNNQNDQQLDGPTNDVKHHHNKAVEDGTSIVFDTPNNTKAKNETNNDPDSQTESEDSEELTGWQKAWYGDERKPKIAPKHFEFSALINDEENKDDIIPLELFPLSDGVIEINKIAEPKFDLFKFIIGTKLKVCIPQTLNPYKFWFHIEDEIHHLDVLMENLAVFYGASGHDLITDSEVPERYMEVGKICAAKYRNEWHRGKILYVGSLVKIFFLDYGTVAEVHRKNLRFLAKEFSKTPAFAHRGVLDMVKPTFGTWPIEVLHFFEKIMKIYQYNLICATITNINVEERTVYFKLADETQIPNFDVAQNLIRHNCAYPTKKSLADFESRHLNEIYPSFDMLESGEYPSVEEIFYYYEEKHFDWIVFDDMRLDPKYLGYETIE